MSAQGGDTVGTQLHRSLDLLHQLYLDVEAADAELHGRARIRETVEALRRQPNLEALPRTLLRVHSELARALQSVRETRQTIQSYSIDRLRDTHVRLSEVSSTTETAAMEMLNGLDRTLAMIDQLESGSREASPKAMCEAVRNEVNQLYGLLQFQDIIAQKLRGVGGLLVEVEQRVEAVANLFDDAFNEEAPRPGLPTPPGTTSYNPDASMCDVRQRQAMVDAAFRSGRMVPTRRTPAFTEQPVLATHPTPPAILLVDDEGCIRASVSRVLTRAGYVVTLAASGAEALQRVRTEAYDAVICDLRMPGLSGIALFDQLQQAAPALAGRILVASGDLSQPDTTVFLTRTGAPALLKPYATRDLLEALTRMCARAEAGSTTETTQPQKAHRAAS
jgi:CheY-like chemotaxis protein